MAFCKCSADGSGIYFVLRNYLGTHHDLKEWLYLTADAPEIVGASGYIDDPEVIAGLDVGDEIYVLYARNPDDLSKGLIARSLYMVLSKAGGRVVLSKPLISQPIIWRTLQ